jgi:hypothetical protein
MNMGVITLAQMMCAYGLIVTISWEGNMCKLGRHNPREIREFLLNKCSFLCTHFEVKGLLLSAGFKIEPLISEMSPCFADEGGSMVGGGSSDFISTCNAQGKGCTTTNMRVVTLAQKLCDLWNLAGVLEQK